MTDVNKFLIRFGIHSLDIIWIALQRERNALSVFYFIKFNNDFCNKEMHR